MSSTETCANFFDMIKSLLNILYDQEWSSPAARHEDAGKLSLSKSIDLHHKLLFSAGLRADIRQDVIIQDSKSLEDVKSGAIQVEASVKDCKKSSAVVEICEIAEKN